MTIRNDAVTVGTSFIEVSPPSLTGNERRLINITNTSTTGQIITLSIGSEAVALAGIVLYPGGYHAESNDAGFKVTQEKINAISSGAGGTLAIHERRGDD